MLESPVEERLRASLIATAGGFLRNPIRTEGVTCSVCTTPVDGYPRCYPCGQHRVHHGLADLVAPLTYAVQLSQSGYVMRGYKAPSPVEEHYRIVATLALLALSRHAACAGALTGVPITHWSSVPSLPAKRGEHPFRRIVKGWAPGAEVPLNAAANCANPRAVDGGHFATACTLPANSHVLLLDDTWTSGGHAQSAALSLRKAGAQKVSLLVAARWVKRDFGGNAKFLDGLPDYDPNICPWTGGVCPHRAM